MWPLDIVVTHPSLHDVIELGSAEADEEVEAFALDRADEGFCEGIGVWSPVWDLNDTSSFGRPDGIEASAELGVGVADQELRRDALFFAPHQSVAGQLRHPCRVRGKGRCAAEYAAAAEMNEHQHIGRSWPTKREHGLREEVAGDHGFHMRADERGPGQGGLLIALFRAWVDARIVQDAFDRIGTGINPELLQLARNALVAPKKVF